MHVEVPNLGTEFTYTNSKYDLFHIIIIIIHFVVIVLFVTGHIWIKGLCFALGTLTNEYVILTQRFVP